MTSNSFPQSAKSVKSVVPIPSFVTFCGKEFHGPTTVPTMNTSRRTCPPKLQRRRIQALTGNPNGMPRLLRPAPLAAPKRSEGGCVGWPLSSIVLCPPPKRFWRRRLTKEDAFPVSRSSCLPLCSLLLAPNSTLMIMQLPTPAPGQLENWLIPAACPPECF